MANTSNETVAKTLGATPDIADILQRRESILGPVRKKREASEKELSEFEGLKSQQEARQQKFLAGQEASAREEKRKAIESAPEVQRLRDVESKLEMESGAFIPTKETAGDMAQLFALVNIAGFALGAGGKRNAQAAMSGMNGMLEGYQKGRADLYKKEKDAFETNFKKLTQTQKILRERISDIAQMADLTLSEKTARAKMAALEMNADFVSKYIDKAGLPRTIETLKEQEKDLEKAYDIVRKEQEKVIENRRRFEEQKQLEGIRSGYRMQEKQAEVDLLEQKQAIKLGTAGPAAAIYKATGKVLPSPKEAAAVVSTSQALREIVSLRERLKDPEIQTGLRSYPEPVLQKVKSLFNQSLSEGDVRSFVDSNLTSNDKTTLFIKDAILAGFKVEQGLTGTRVPVFTQKVVGPILDPRSYTPQTYDKLLATREKELYGTGADYGFDKNELDLIARTGQAREAAGGEAASAPNAQTIPQAAIDALKSGKGTREQFDSVFGAGAAARVLGGK